MGALFTVPEPYNEPVRTYPSGSADRALDVDAVALAERELREETGLVTDTLIPLGTLDVAPSMFNQRCAVFLATGLTPGAP